MTEGVIDVGEWLAGLGLEDCRATFDANDIDGAVLPDLTEADLIELGLSLGKRKKLLSAIAALKAPPAAPAPVPAAPPALADRGERRQVTILFCDLVGSTRMAASLDPELMAAVLRRALDAVSRTITQHDGYVAKFMGDGVLAYFGWPAAQEDSAVQAARTGLALVAAVRALSSGEERLQVRVGIATGLVVIGEILGDGMAREHVVTGATANLAARLQAAADPDAVLVGQTTRRLLGDRFRLADAGALSLKGFPEPVPAFQLMGEAEAGVETMRESTQRQPFIGREGECAALLDWWEETVGNGGRVVLVQGESGMGKTQLAEGFRSRLTAGSFFRLRLHCAMRRDSSALYPVASAIRLAAGFQPGDDAASEDARLNRLLDETGVADERIAQAFRTLLGRRTAVTPDFDPSLRKARTLQALGDFVIALAKRRPLLLHLEDAHWADPTTLDLIDAIAARAADVPILILVTARPEFTHAWPEGVRTHHLPIERLNAEACGALVQSILGEGRLPPSVLRQILARSDGIPLHVEELTRELLETRALTRGDTGWTLAAAGASMLSVPALLSDRLLARLDRLGWVKPVAQAAAVVGRDFSLALVAPLVSLPEVLLVEAMGVLLDAGLITADGPLSDGRFSFRHALVHDAAYAGLLIADRRQLHARVADTLEADHPALLLAQPDMLAHHLSEGGQHARAVDWWRKAGRRNSEAASYAEAAAQYDRALQSLLETPPGPDRDTQEAKLLTEMLVALQATEGYTSERVRATIDRVVSLSAAEGVGGEEPLIGALAGQLSLAYGSSHVTRAVGIGEQLIAAADQGGNPSYRVFARAMMGMALTGRGALQQALDCLDEALALSDAGADRAFAIRLSLDPRITALAYKALVLEAMGRAEEAEAIDALALSGAEEGQHLPTIGLAATLHLSRLLVRHDPAAIAAAAALLHGHAVRQESMPLQAVAGSVLGLLRAREAPDDAIFAAVRHTVGAIRAAGWNLMVAWISLLEVEVSLQHGRVEPALETLRALKAIVDPRGHHFFMPELLRLEGEAARLAGNHEAAAARLAEAIETARRQGARAVEARAAADHARLAAALSPS